MLYDVRMSLNMLPDVLPDVLTALALAFPIPVTDAGCPGYYYDPCDTVEFWSSLTPHNAQQIPSDGVLVLQGARNGSWDDGVLTNIDLTVTLDGQPIAGALELGPAPGVLVWRPEAAWVPGATYELSGSVNNMNPDGVVCAPGSLPIASDVVIADEPGAPFGKPGLSGAPSVLVQPMISLDSLACCEGAAPSSGYGSCYGNDSYLDWDPAECAPLAGVGYLTVEFTGTPAAAGPAAQQIVYTRRINGAWPLSSLDPSFSFTSDAPFCASLEARDLASGAFTTSASLCFGDQVAEQLGPQDLAAPDTLTCALQQCEVVGGGWNLDNCSPVDPSPDSGTAGGGEEDDKGCGCSSGASDAPGPGALLGLVGLLGLARRRPR